MNRRVVVSCSGIIISSIVFLFANLLTGSDAIATHGSVGNILVSPVEIVVSTNGPIDATGITVGRMSPLGNFSSFTIASDPGETTVWRSNQSFVYDFLIVPDDPVVESSSSIEIRVGNTRTSYAWEEVKNWPTEEVELPSYVDVADSKMAYVLPHDRESNQPSVPGFPWMSRLVNYRGHGAVAVSIFLFASALTMAIVFLWRLPGHIPFELAERKGFAGPIALSLLIVYLNSYRVYWLLNPQITDIVIPLRIPALVCLFGSLAIVAWKGRSAATDELGAFGERRLTPWIMSGTVVGVAFILRIWRLEYLQALDSFSITAAKALLDTGVFSYQRNSHITRIVARSFESFGMALSAARIPIVAYSLATFVPLYFVSRRLGRSVSFVATILFAVSPVAIEKSSHVREYSETLFLVTVLVAVAVIVWERLRTRPVLHTTVQVATALLAVYLVFRYEAFGNNATIASALQVYGFFVVIIAGIVLYRGYPRKKWFVVAAIIGFFAVFYLQVQRFGPFGSEVTWSGRFLSIFFDSMHGDTAQWWSLLPISPLPVFAVVFVIPWFGNPSEIRRDLYLAILGTFVLSLALFLTRTTIVPRGRYVYQLFSIFTILFAVGLVQLVCLCRNALGVSRPVFFTVAAVAVLSFINPLNTAEAANRTASRYYGPRQVSSLATENRVFGVVEFLNAIGVTSNTPVILNGQRPDLFSWLLNRSVSREYGVHIREDGSRTGTAYDLAERLYFVGRNNRYPNLEWTAASEAIATYGAGYYLTMGEEVDRWASEAPKSLEREYIASVRSYRIFRVENSR